MLHLVFAAVVAQATPAQTPCAQPNYGAQVTTAMNPDYPDSARKLELGPVHVLVDVSVDANGRISATKIAHSSRNPAIDNAAMIAARQSTYAPAVIHCIAADSVFRFRAEFDPDNGWRSLPSIMVPADWKRKDSVFGQQTWEKGNESLRVRASETDETLQQYLSEESTTPPNASDIDARLVKVCNQKFDAWQMVSRYKSDKNEPMTRASVQLFDRGVRYSASF